MTDYPFYMPQIRASEIQRVLRDRYGGAVPDDDAGREDVEIMLRHVAHLPHGDKRMNNFVEVYASWLVDGERVDFLNAASRSAPPWLTADQLAEQLNVDFETRQALGLRTIGAVDCPKDDRKAQRKAWARLRARLRRRASGAKIRASYIAASLSKGKKPWEAEGISRATWYRLQKQQMHISKR